MTFSLADLEKAICKIQGNVALDKVAQYVDFFKSFNETNKNDLALCSLCSHIGVQYSEEQISFRNKIEQGEASKMLAQVNQLLGGLSGPFIAGDEPGKADAQLLHAMIPVFSTSVMPKDRETKYAAILTWFQKCLSLSSSLKVHMIGSVRIGNQIDLFPNSKVVRNNADHATELNRGYKKKATQRQLEKAAKEKGFKLPAAAEKFGFSEAEKITDSLSVKEKIKRVEEALSKACKQTSQHEVVEHEATPDMDTVSRVLKGKSGFLCKNLFLKAKKPRKNMENDSTIWLVCAPKEAKINYPELTKALGYSPKAELRQAAPELLTECLDLKPGHVTPFGLINDPSGRVNVVLDKSMMSDENAKLWFHPLTNEASIQISSGELAAFIACCARTPILVDFEREDSKEITSASNTAVIHEPLTHAEAQEKLWSYLAGIGCSPYKEKDVDLNAKRPVGHSTHNLFVKDKKTKKNYLIAVKQDAQADLKDIAKQISGAKELRMSQDRKECFSSEAGCLTLLNLYNNPQGDVTPVIDSRLLQFTEPLRICAGCSDPLDHSQHNVVDITKEQLQKLMKDSNTPEPIVINVEK